LGWNQSVQLDWPNKPSSAGPTRQPIWSNQIRSKRSVDRSNRSLSPLPHLFALDPRVASAATACRLQRVPATPITAGGLGRWPSTDLPRPRARISWLLLRWLRRTHPRLGFRFADAVGSGATPAGSTRCCRHDGGLYKLVLAWLDAGGVVAPLVPPLPTPPQAHAVCRGDVVQHCSCCYNDPLTLDASGTALPPPPATPVSPLLRLLGSNVS
jgi:hypothetical protein